MKLRRAPLLAIGLLSMAIGAWLGLMRLGWSLPPPAIDRPILHGPLMVCGFLGTVIAVERAIAFGGRWAFLSPILIALGAVVTATGVFSPAGPVLITAGSVALTLITLAICVRHPSLFIGTILAGAVTWMAGNLFWLKGLPLTRVVPWWLAFLVLTIAGERLELNRVLRPSARSRAWFVAAVGVTLIALVLSIPFPIYGPRLFGLGLAGLAAWLWRYDLARRTVRLHGLTRFMAIALLTGYVWLGAGGLLAATYGISMPGLLYDATLHAIFVGFVLSMVFAHAPVIFPAVLGTPLPYRPAFYVHLVVLHVSLAIRISGDLLPGLQAWRAWGGLLNAAALVLFVGNMAQSIVRARRSGTASGTQIAL